jgi:2,5-diketo-D-gluconate reductase A
VLRWLIQRNAIAIPESVRKERMAENIDVFGFGLPDDQMARTAKLGTGKTLFTGHRDPAMVSRLGTVRVA